MKIGFDGKRFFFNFTGLGNYSRSTIRQLAQFYPENSYHIFTPKTTQPGLDYAKVYGVEVHPPLGLTGKTFPSFWRSVLLGNELSLYDLDIYHGLSHELPLLHPKGRTKRIVTMHDLIFIRHPELYSRLDALIYKKKYFASCHAADMIIATSEQTKQDLIHFFQIPKEKIRVVYQSCDPLFYQRQDSAQLQKTASRLDLPSSYILSVGSISPRKQPDTLIRALALFPPEERLPLIFAGTGSSSYTKKLHDLVHQLGLDSLVHFKGRIETQDLPALYQLATVFVYPSLFEGFGIPILEALFSETPVITSDVACMREVGGPAALYTKPGNPSELSSALSSVLNDCEKRKQMTHSGKKHAQQFHESNSAANLMDCYQELLKA